jgi:transcriptional regulator with XRE-family HTH domain
MCETYDLERVLETFFRPRSMSGISSAQGRAARGMLDWSMLDLAKAACVSISTVKRFEDEQAASVSEAAEVMIREAFEVAGIRFLPNDGTGSGLRLQARQQGRRA